VGQVTEVAIEGQGSSESRQASRSQWECQGYVMNVKVNLFNSNKVTVTKYNKVMMLNVQVVFVIV